MKPSIEKKLSMEEMFMQKKLSMEYMKHELCTGYMNICKLLILVVNTNLFFNVSQDPCTTINSTHSPTREKARRERKRERSELTSGEEERAARHAKVDRNSTLMPLLYCPYFLLERPPINCKILNYHYNLLQRS